MSLAEESQSQIVIVDGQQYILDYDQQGDEATEPVCSMGSYADGTPDPDMPGEGCCRVYSRVGFRGQMWEFCVMNDAVTTYDLKEDQDLWPGNWYKEISSLKCGGALEKAEFFFEEPDKKPSTIGKNSINKISPQDEYVKVILYPEGGCGPNESLECPKYGHLFSAEGCVGDMRKISYDAAVGHSGFKYKTPDAWTWAQGTAKSVRLALGDAIELYGNPKDSENGVPLYFNTDNASLAYDKPAGSGTHKDEECFNFKLLTDSDVGGEGTSDNLHNFHSFRLKKKGFTDCAA